jgi:predicted transcriptional regulator
MKKLIVELDDEIAAKIERMAPGRTRQRSEFINNALRNALWQTEEEATAEAYRKQPDMADSACINSDVWECRPKTRRNR